MLDTKNLPKASSEGSFENFYEKLQTSLARKNSFYKEKINEKEVKACLRAIFGNSSFLSNLVVKHNEFFLDLLDGDFKLIFDEIIYEIDQFNSSKRERIEAFLREKKQQMSLLIATAEISELWSTAKVMERLSEFADACVSKTVDFLLKEAHKKKIIELEDPNNPTHNSGLIVIALGKLGSYELNYSSDIDICVFYEEAKLQYNGKRDLPYFFISMSQDIIDILSKRTQDGYVFRVDMRLRPDPAANPLAVNLTKAEKYYFTVGQNWERAAMIKARQICGDLDSTRIFFNFMNKNIWRRALDFETIEDIHSIKRQIDTKQGVHPENLYGFNVKLGWGGIREIEFYCQTQQLIWGGRKHSLRVKKILNALNELEKEGEISEEARDELSEAYLFLRKVEHRLQMINDEQTHTLPRSEENFAKVAIFCGYKDSESFKKDIIKYIQLVNKHYSKLFETSPSLAINSPEASGNLVFTGSENDPETLKTLNKMGFKEAEKVGDIIRGWHHGRCPCTLKKRSRAVLTKLMPMLISSFSKAPDPDIALNRFDEFLRRLPEESQIFSMLYLNPSIMDVLSEVMGGYQQIAVNLIKNPDLLDYVLAPEFYHTLPDREYLKQNLKALLDSINAEIIDDKFEVIKDWANDRKFRLGIQLVRDEITTEEVQLGLSNIADVVIEFLLHEIDDDFRENIGVIEDGNFAVILLGKLGSKELTFNSDLDLVFVYEHPESIFSAGKSNLSPGAYYLRYASKLVYGLSSITRTGKLYEVDLRLRPLGDASPLAIPLKTYEEYFNPYKDEGSAWVWEYMALNRARVISLNPEFKDKVSDIIESKMQHKWEQEKIEDGISHIYKKYRNNKSAKGSLDVKNLRGGLFDLDFLIRYLQLKHVCDDPDLATTGTVDAIERLYDRKIITKAEKKELIDSYYFYSTILNILRITSNDKVTIYTEKVICRLLEFSDNKKLYKKLNNHTIEVEGIFKKYLSFIKE